MPVVVGDDGDDDGFVVDNGVCHWGYRLSESYVPVTNDAL